MYRNNKNSVIAFFALLLCPTNMILQASDDLNSAPVVSVNDMENNNVSSKEVRSVLLMIAALGSNIIDGDNNSLVRLCVISLCVTIFDFLDTDIQPNDDEKEGVSWLDRGLMIAAAPITIPSYAIMNLQIAQFIGVFMNQFVEVPGEPVVLFGLLGGLLDGIYMAYQDCKNGNMSMYSKVAISYCALCVALGNILG